MSDTVIVMNQGASSRSTAPSGSTTTPAPPSSPTSSQREPVPGTRRHGGPGGRGTCQDGHRSVPLHPFRPRRGRPAPRRGFVCVRPEDVGGPPGRRRRAPGDNEFAGVVESAEFPSATDSNSSSARRTCPSRSTGERAWPEIGPAAARPPRATSPTERGPERCPAGAPVQAGAPGRWRASQTKVLSFSAWPQFW